MPQVKYAPYTQQNAVPEKLVTTESVVNKRTVEFQISEQTQKIVLFTSILGLLLIAANLENIL